MDLPTFKFHPDPVASGSVEASNAKCVCCNQSRGMIYVGPVYAEEELSGKLCPWCIADGSASQKFDATFVDETVLDDSWPDDAAEEIAQRTPGFDTWQGEAWPTCCDDATAFHKPMGIAEIRKDHYEWEGPLMGYVVHEMQISGGAATRLVDSLNRDKGPTAYVFICRHCNAVKFHVDQK
ncbi:CbrC family protein [soil metagenome]